MSGRKEIDFDLAERTAISLSGVHPDVLPYDIVNLAEAYTILKYAFDSEMKSHQLWRDQLEHENKTYREVNKALRERLSELSNTKE